MGKKTITDARVTDLEKRRYPTKHYVYVLEISWSEGSSTVVYRRYSDFFEFQCGLLEKFPVEAGTKDPTQRMIPFLPGKKLLGRSHIRSVAEKRKDKIDEYCRALIRLPPNISDCDFVIDFFEVRQTDLEKPKKPKPVKGQPKINEISDPLILERYVAIADYEKQKKNECSIMAGQTAEVIDKNENGWWFVNVDDFHEGWVPATYLEPLYGSEDISVQKLDPGEEETWISMNEYEAKHSDEISFEKGVLLEVFEKGMDGWWKVRYQGKEGMVPAAYLQRYHGQGAGQASTGAQVVSTLKDVVEDTETSSSSSSKPSKPSKSTGAPVAPRTSTTLSPTSPPKPSSPSESLTMSLNVSYDSTSSEASSNSQQKMSAAVVANLASTLQAGSSGPTSPTAGPKPASSVAKSVAPTPGPKSASSVAPTPGPKPAGSVAVAAAALAEKQKFAPTWHSQAKSNVDEEPIYAPTPRRISIKKPMLQKRNVMDVSEPVYEIIPEPEVEIYVTISDYTATTGDGISFKAGMECTVVTKNPAGWWYVDMEGDEGWVPSSYLERKVSSTVESTKQPPKPPPPFQSSKLHQQQKQEKSVPAVSKELRKETVSKDTRRDTGGAAKREPPSKREPLKKEIAAAAAAGRKDPPQVGARKMSSLSKTVESTDGREQQGRRKSSLRRSTSTDSGLNEDAALKTTETRKQFRSPPPIRVSKAAGPPPRPQNAPTLPNTGRTSTISAPKSPRLSKATISGPMPYQPSPGSRRKSDAVNKSAANTSSRLNTTRPSLSGPRTPPARPVGRPQQQQGRKISDERISTVLRANSGGGDHIKKKQLSSPDLPVRGISSADRRATGGDILSSSSRPRRRSSADGEMGNKYKSELEKKLQLGGGGGGGKPAAVSPSSSSSSSSSSSAQPPKRPSPPNRPKAPAVKSTGTGGARSRPPPPKPQAFVPGKRPPPPRPSGLPRKPSYITIGDYSGGDSCLSFKEGEDVEVVEKNDDGWWFVKIGGGKEGWAPSTYIEEKEQQQSDASSNSQPPPPPTRPKATSPTTANGHAESSDTADSSTPKPKPRPRPRKGTAAFYRATDSYDPSVDNGDTTGLSLVQGRVYELKEKNDEGWWLMKDGDTEGWAPSTYLQHI